MISVIVGKARAARLTTVSNAYIQNREWLLPGDDPRSAVGANKKWLVDARLGAAGLGQNSLPDADLGN